MRQGSGSGVRGSRWKLEPRTLSFEPSRSEHGMALLAVLGLLLALLPVAAAVSVQAELDALMQRNCLGSTEALYGAEAGLAHAFAEIPPATSLRALLGVADASVHEATFPFRSQPPLDTFYQVRVRVDQSNTVSLLSIGHGTHGALRELEMIVVPGTTPFTPAALYIEAPDIDLDLGARGFSVSGDASGGNTPEPSAVAAIAVTAEATAAALRNSPVAAHIIGTGGGGSIVTSTSLDLDSYVTLLRNRLEAVVHTSAPPTGGGLGTVSAPQLTVIDDAWQTTGDMEGFGILAVRGDMEINGALRYGGLIVVTGKLRVTDSSDLRIEGAMWLRNTGLAHIKLLGTGFIRYDSTNLKRTAAALEGALFHLPQVAGWRELS